MGRVPTGLKSPFRHQFPPSPGNFSLVLFGEVFMATCATREALRGRSGLREEKNKRMEVTTSSWSCPPPRGVGGIMAICPSSAAPGCVLCAEVAVDATPAPTARAAWLNLAPLSPTPDPCVWGAGGLNPFPAKPLSVKQRSFMSLHKQHPCCWATAAARRPSPPRGPVQCPARTEPAGRSSPPSLWGALRQHRSLCAAAHCVIGTATLKTPHTSKNKSMFYCLDEQRQPFGFGNSQVAPQEQGLASQHQALCSWDPINSFPWARINSDSCLCVYC